VLFVLVVGPQCDWNLLALKQSHPSFASFSFLASQRHQLRRGIASRLPLSDDDARFS
jgi:hypothetical protein